MKTKHILLLILSVFVLTACTQSKLRNHHQALPKTWTINLLITGNGNNASMKVNTGPMRNCINENNGCMVFSSNEKGAVTFDMSGNDGGFHITQLKICKGEVPPDPIDKDCPLLANALDFYVMKGETPIIPNLSTGKIKWAYSDAVKSFVLHNQNVLKQKYYYMVIACDASDHCPLADPAMDNKGAH